MSPKRKFYALMVSSLSLAYSIVYASCGPATGPTGGQCTLTNDDQACYQTPWVDGGCAGTGKGNCLSSAVPEPLLICTRYVYAGGNTIVCTPTKTIGNRNVLSGTDESGLCGG